jgi:hypothetical protein
MNRMRRHLTITALLSCLIYLTEFRGEADYIVYLTDFRGEDTAKGLFKPCRFSKFRAGAWKVYVSQFRGEADLIVYRKDFATRR